MLSWPSSGVGRRRSPRCRGARPAVCVSSSWARAKAARAAVRAACRPAVGPPFAPRPGRPRRAHRTPPVRHRPRRPRRCAGRPLPGHRRVLVAARACACRPAPRPPPARAELVVVEPDQRFAGKHLVVGLDQHLGDQPDGRRRDLDLIPDGGSTRPGRHRLPALVVGLHRPMPRRSLDGRAIGSNAP